MRFLSYERNGSVRHGRTESTDGPIVELGDGDLLSLLEGEGLGSASRRSGPELAPAEVRILAPIRRPPKLLAVAANYAEHVRAGGKTPVDPTRATPRLFLKPSSAIIGPDEPLVLPAISDNVDWEVELAVVIGGRCRNLPVEDALSVVGGYMTSNDVSARRLDFGFERDPEMTHKFMDWLAGKWADGFAPIGPYLVTADEVPDPHDLDLHLEVNGTTFQQGSTSGMIFGVRELISYASSFMTLEPGDIIETGTPTGAGAASGTFLAPGDLMVARVGNLGELKTPVVAP